MESTEPDSQITVICVPELGSDYVVMGEGADVTLWLKDRCHFLSIKHMEHDKVKAFIRSIRAKAAANSKDHIGLDEEWIVIGGVRAGVSAAGELSNGPEGYLFKATLYPD